MDLGSVANRLLLTLLGVGFFVVKFGGFALVSGLFVLLLPALLTAEGEAQGITLWRPVAGAGPAFVIAAAALGLSHGVSFVRNFLMGREYDRVNVLRSPSCLMSGCRWSPSFCCWASASENCSPA